MPALAPAMPTSDSAVQKSDPATQKPREFRFAAISAPTPWQTGRSWREQVKQIEGLGFASLFVPDGVHLLSPFQALATAAAVTTTLTLTTFVLASPLREPGAAAWEANSLAVLAEGRFELGLGTGRPSMKEETAVVGASYGTGASRLEQMAETIRRFRALDGDRHTPLMIAAAGPKAVALAAAEANIFTVPIGPLSTREEAADMVRRAREAAGDRVDELEFCTSIFAIGDELAEPEASFLGVDMATLIENDSLLILRGDDQAMADELERRREELGISYFGVSGSMKEKFAPVVARLAGR